MADSSYDMEVKSILAFLHMQRPAAADQVDGSGLDVQPEEFVAPRFVKKLKTKQVREPDLLVDRYKAVFLLSTLRLVSIFSHYISVGVNKLLRITTVLPSSGN